MNHTTVINKISDLGYKGFKDAYLRCKKRMNLATNNGNTWSDKTVLFGH